LKYFLYYTSEDLNPHPYGGAPFKYVTGNLVALRSKCEMV